MVVAMGRPAPPEPRVAVTTRERFRRTLGYSCPDRPPLFDEGLRDEVLVRWRSEGLPQDADLQDLFRYDRRESLSIDFGPRPGLGRPVETRRDLREFRKRLDPTDPGRLPIDWDQIVARESSRTDLLQLFVHNGLFLTHGADRWPGVTALLYRVHDDPILVRGVLEAYAECVVGVLARVLPHVQPDFIGFSEPISGPDRPLISPRMYRSLVLPSYTAILRAARAGGCRAIVFQTYANSRALLPAVVEAGFDCLWSVESPPGSMDYAQIRREFGRDLRLIGGIDLDTLRQPSDAIRRDLLAAVPPLLADGGYIPLADGRVRPDISFESYRAYRDLLSEMTA